jgi:phage-related protein
MHIEQMMIYQDLQGKSQLIEWLDSVPEDLQINIIVQLERLREYGTLLEWPECEDLGSDVYELRIRAYEKPKKKEKTKAHNFRIYYALTNTNNILVSHGCEIPGVSANTMLQVKEIQSNLNLFEKEPHKHTYSY